MNPEAPMRGNRRGFRRWSWIAIIIALPFAALISGNLWLASPSGRGWIAAKIQRQTGLETRIGRVSISPWNGVRMHQAELLQPAPLRPAVKEPLARIETIRLTPVWRSWLRGRRELQSVEFDSPRFVIPLELLADLARARAPAATAAAPPVAVATPPPVTPPATSPPAPTGWLHLKNASFTLLSASSRKQWFQVSGLSGSIPVSGSPAESTLRVRSIRAAGREVLTNLNAALDWRAPFLSMKPFEMKIQGFQLDVTGRLGLLTGLPMQLEAQAPRQPFAAAPLPDNGFVAAESIAANARLRGFLLAPGTWQGEFVAEALSPSARVAGHDAKFDRGGAVTLLRGGALTCTDARLIGDDLSLLGNATLLADGRCAAALRLVAPPDSAAAIVNRAFPNLRQAPALTELATPQRAAFDLEAFGNIRQISLRLGKHGPVAELKH